MSRHWLYTYLDTGSDTYLDNFFNLHVLFIAKFAWDYWQYAFLGMRSKIFSPKSRPGKSKYGPSNGLVTSRHFQHLPISMSTADALSKAANSGLSTQTWSSYKTAKNHLARCQNDTNVLITFPLNTEKVFRGSFSKGKSRPSLPKCMQEDLWNFHLE